MRSTLRAAAAALLPFSLAFSLVPGLVEAPVHAARAPGRIQGAVTDQLGAGLAGIVTLTRDDAQVAETTAGATGAFTFSDLAPGRYIVTARADGFEPAATAVIVRSGSVATVSLATERRTDRAACGGNRGRGGPAPGAQRCAGERAAVRDHSIAWKRSTSSRCFVSPPPANIVQNAGRGGTTSVFIRGGDSDFNKVLIDGVPANDIGGAFDWAAVAASGIDRVEVLRAANSVAYGADALNGVISLTTPRGSTRTPEATYTAGWRQLRHFAPCPVARRFRRTVRLLRRRVALPHPQRGAENNAYGNVTGAGRFGIRLGASTDISITARRMDADYEAPNGILYYGRPDDSSQALRLTLVGVTAHAQVTRRLQTALQVRFHRTGLRLHESGTDR